MKTMRYALLAGLLLLPAASVHATLLTIDQVIFQTGTGQNTSLMTGTLDVTVSGAHQLTFTMTNTSADGAFTDATAPASMLLTGFGVQVGANITSGTVSVPGTSMALNFDAGQSATDISNQYVYANSAIDGYSLSGVLAVNNIVSSVNNGGATRFAGPPPVNADGPGYGALSANETQFGTSTPGVKDAIVFVLNFDNTNDWTMSSPISGIGAGNVVLAFGSPDTVRGPNPPPASEPGTMLLLGSGLSGLVVVRRMRSRA